MDPFTLGLAGLLISTALGMQQGKHKADPYNNRDIFGNTKAPEVDPNALPDDGYGY